MLRIPNHIPLDCHIVYHNHLSSLQQAFSVFFVCVAFTSDIICLLFIPVQWLFFAASTYVWVQYVWHTGKMMMHYLVISNINTAQSQLANEKKTKTIQSVEDIQMTMKFSANTV